MIEKLGVLIVPVTDSSSENIIKEHNLVENINITDITDVCLKELYEIKHPERKDNFEPNEYETFLKSSNIDTRQYGNWVYIDWRNLLIKIPPVEDFRLLRTARNQLLIRPREQLELFKKTVLIAGMSVGSNVLEQIVHGGIAGTVVLADMDTIELTNLNRVKVGIPDIGKEKVISAAQKALELDPYLNIYVIKTGITSETLEAIEAHEYIKLDLIVDEVDDIAAKVLLREKAKQLSLPLIMATDNSDGAIIDIERYDANSNQIMFNDRIPAEVLEAMISGKLPREQAGAVIGKYFVGIDLVDNRLLESLAQVRRSIPSWPQLGTAASLSGILAGFSAKTILLGGSLVGDRYVDSYDKQMNSSFHSDEYSSARDEILKVVKSNDS